MLFPLSSVQDRSLHLYHLNGRMPKSKMTQEEKIPLEKKKRELSSSQDLREREGKCMDSIVYTLSVSFKNQQEIIKKLLFCLHFYGLQNH
jgi:hypothetical protein